MKIIIAALLCFVTSVLYCSEKAISDYKKTFGKDYDKAIAYLSENQWINDSLKKENINPGFAVAIIFPELIRYSAIQDIIEVSALKTLYIQYGTKYSDFSIGHFQMKPSFAEKTEEIFSAKNKKTKFSKKNSPQARLERIKRLDSDVWQLRYLIMFIKIMDSRFANERFINESEKLRFYATAYNCGFTKSAQEIRSKMNSCFFSTEFIPVEDTKLYCYSDISVFFFENGSD